MKLKGHIHVFRIEIEMEKELSDSQFRLFQLFRKICVWDRRNKYFGFTDAITKDIKNLYLNWSTGKISETRKELIEKGWLVDTKRRRFRYGVKNTDFISPKNVRDTEMTLQNPEPKVQNSEQLVREIEDKKLSIGKMPNEISAENLYKSYWNIQRSEHGTGGKEIQKKDKEIINTNESTNKNIPIWRDEERFNKLKEIARERKI